MKNKSNGGKLANQGFTLVELLVGIALGTFVLLGLVSATTALLRGDSLVASRMGGELRSAVFVIERDISRSAYHGAAAAALQSGPATYSNPFAALDVSTPGCVLYSYDLDSDGIQDVTAGSDERFALALFNNQLYLRRDGPAHDCDVTKGSWEPMFDAAVLNVSAFTVSLDTHLVDVPGSTRKVQVRKLTYTLTVQLKKEPSRTQTHTNTLALPNDVLT